MCEVEGKLEGPTFPEDEEGEVALEAEPAFLVTADGELDGPVGPVLFADADTEVEGPASSDEDRGEVESGADPVF